MNQAIANIIKNHISGLDFIDKIAGLVSACTFDIIVRDKENNPTTVQKTFPIACCLTEKCTIETAYQDLMPNSDYKTVIYFEDKGVSWVKTEGRYKHYTSNVRLVCWINVAKILGDTCKEGDTCTLSTHLITEIIRSLPEFPGHHNPFNMVFSEVIDQEVRSPSIFSTYTYDEKHSQYLMYPYDYFALDIQTSFAICMKGTQVYNADCSSTDLDNLAVPVATEATGIGSGSFTAHWNTVDGATGYAIDVATDPAFTDFVLQDARVGNALSVSITNLDEQTTYYYRVRAYNDYTESENSNVINLITEQSGQIIFGPELIDQVRWCEVGLSYWDYKSDIDIFSGNGIKILSSGYPPGTYGLTGLLQEGERYRVVVNISYVSGFFNITDFGVPYDLIVTSGGIFSFDLICNDSSGTFCIDTTGFHGEILSLSVKKIN